MPRSSIDFRQLHQGRRFLYARSLGAAQPKKTKLHRWRRTHGTWARIEGRLPGAAANRSHFHLLGVIVEELDKAS
jgi:hypothetical protein